MDEGLTFGPWVRQRRRSLDLTQKELAEAAGCAVITVRKMEGGEFKPSKMLARSLAEALDISPDEVDNFIAFARGTVDSTLADETARARSRPWSTSGQVSSNLPLLLKPLIGREHDMGAVRGLLSRPEVRLVTISGPPGVGKTSLAIKIAHEMRPLFHGGCFFVELADIQEAKDVPRAIAKALQMKPSTGRPVLEQLLSFLLEKELLLLLDNFEHVLTAASSVFTMLQGCAGLKIVATSRTSLQLTLENQYPLSPLLLPHPNRQIKLEEMEEYPSVKLFVSRAKAVNPGFHLSEHNVADIIAICHRLDGLPLAIDLAVTKTKGLSPAELLSRMDEFISLRVELMDLPQRQRSLQLAIDWSYDLLSELEKAVFVGMAVFSGGCSLTAAEAVFNCAYDIHVVETLTTLLDNNLLFREKKTGYSRHTRITMLKTIRDYAQLKFNQSDFKERVQECHANFYLDLVREARSELRGPDQILWLDRLEREHLNLRCAILWALEAGKITIALGLTSALARYWELRSHLEEGRSLLENAIDKSKQMDLDLSQKSLLAMALRGVSAIAQNQGDLVQANRWGQESLSIWQNLGDNEGEAGTYHTLGLVAQGQKKLEQAKEYHWACLHLSQQLGDEIRIYISLYNLAEIASWEHDYELAEQLHQESLVLKEKHGDLWSISWSKFCLAKLAGYRGEWQKAAELHQESLQLRQQLGDKEAMAESLVGFAYLATKTGAISKAARLLGGAYKLLEVSGGAFSPHVTELYQHNLAAIESASDSDNLSACIQEGQSMSTAAVISHALEPIFHSED